MKKLITILVIALFLGSLFTLIPNTPSVQAQSVSLQTITLPEGTPQPWKMVYDGSRYIWFTGYISPANYGYVVKIDTWNLISNPLGSVSWYKSCDERTPYGEVFAGVGGSIGIALLNGFIWTDPWYIGKQDRGALSKFDPATNTYTMYYMPDGYGAGLRDLETDGTYLWIAGSGIIRFDPSTETWNRLSLSSSPYDLLLDGNIIWFSNEKGIGKINKDGACLTYYPTPSGSLFLAKAPDGKIWYSSNIANNIGSLDPISGLITEYDIGIPHYEPFSENWIDGPYGLTFDTQGKLWVAGYRYGAMIKFDTSALSVSNTKTPNAPYYPISIVNQVWCWGQGSVDMNIITLQEPTKIVTRYPFELKIWYPTQAKYGEQVNIHVELKNIGDKSILNTKLYFKTYPYYSTIDIGILEPSKTITRDFTIVANRYWLSASIRAIGQYEFTRHTWKGDYSYYRYVGISAYLSIRVLR
jgi:streptogramin lyase